MKKSRFAGFGIESTIHSTRNCPDFFFFRLCKMPLVCYPYAGVKIEEESD